MELVGELNRSIMECKCIDFLAKVYRIGVRVMKIMEREL